jgi:hypothetical protein
VNLLARREQRGAAATVFDPPGQSWLHWRDRPSLDACLGPGPSPHAIDLFQEGSAQPRRLDLRIWFGQIQITTLDNHDIPAPDFIASGARWWDGPYSGDSRTSGQGIVPPRRIGSSGRGLHSTPTRRHSSSPDDGPEIVAEAPGQLEWLMTDELATSAA